MAWFNGKDGGGGVNAISGTTTMSTSVATEIKTGFKPKHIGAILYKDNTHFVEFIYHEDIATDRQYFGYLNSSGSNTSSQELPYTGGTFRIKSINNDGFTMSILPSSNVTAFGTTLSWFASE